MAGRLEELTAALASASEDARLHALTGLAQIGTGEVLPLLSSATRDAAPAVRVLARQLSAELRQKLDASREPSGQDPLSLIASPDPRARLAGALLCYEQTSDALRAALLARFPLEDDAHVRASLVKALGRYPDQAVVELLSETLQDPDPRVRSNTVEALMFYEHPALFARVANLLADPDNRVKSTVLIYLARRKPERVRPILEKMTQAPETWVRRAARHAFRALGWEPPADEPSEAVRAVQDMFAHEEPDVRIQAVWRALTLERHERQLALRGQLAREEHPHVVATLVRALGLAADPADVALIVPHLASADARVRANAVEGLGAIGGAEALAAIEARLTDDAPRVRAAVTLHLARTRRRQAVEILRALADSDRLEDLVASLHALVHLPADEARRVANLTSYAVTAKRRVELVQALEALRPRSASALHDELTAILAVPPETPSGTAPIRSPVPDDAALAALGLEVLRAWEAQQCRQAPLEELVTGILADEESISRGLDVVVSLPSRRAKLVQLGQRAVDLARADALDAPTLRARIEALAPSPSSARRIGRALAQSPLIAGLAGALIGAAVVAVIAVGLGWTKKGELVAPPRPPG